MNALYSGISICEMQSALNRQYNVMGIDLGTCYSCVTVFKNGQFHVIGEDGGNRTIPSYVAIQKNMYCYGNAAKVNAGKNADSTVFDIKRMIGRSFTEVMNEKMMNEWPFEFADFSGRPAVLILTGENTHNYYYPEYFCSMLLFYLKSLASNFLGMEVKKAVITVPAFFGPNQRLATCTAAQNAGIEVLALYEEPSAAALAYSINASLRTNHILVYDLGGGTFDVSLIRVEGNSSKVIDADGHGKLGGQDFDALIMKDIIDQIQAKYPGTLINNRRSNYIRKIAEECKRLLSSELSAEEYITIGGANPIEMDYTLTRTRFERMIHELLLTSIRICQNVVSRQGVNLDSIVLVGGSSHIPLVMTLLKTYFPNCEIRSDINPDEVVSQGACKMAVNMYSREVYGTDVFDFKVVSMVLRSLGIRIEDSKVEIVLPRGKNVNEYYDVRVATPYRNMSTMVLTLVQGEPGEGNYVPIGTLKVENLPPGHRGMVGVIVRLLQDDKGVLHAYAYEEHAKNYTETHVNLYSQIPPESIDGVVEQIQADIKMQTIMNECNSIRNEIITFLNSSSNFFKFKVLPFSAVARRGRAYVKECSDNMVKYENENNPEVLKGVYEEIKKTMEEIKSG